MRSILRLCYKIKEYSVFLILDIGQIVYIGRIPEWKSLLSNKYCFLNFQAFLNKFWFSDIDKKRIGGMITQTRVLSLKELQYC